MFYGKVNEEIVVGSVSTLKLKCPIMGYERFIFWLGVPNNRLTFIQGIYFLHYLLNISQTIRSTMFFFQTAPLYANCFMFGIRFKNLNYDIQSLSFERQ